jgi:hypothetical protein
MKIYLDVEQCGLFGVHYFPQGEVLVASAEAILRSRGFEYDKIHKDYLEPLSSQTLILEQTESCDPGWWEVIKTL